MVFLCIIIKLNGSLRSKLSQLKDHTSLEKKWVSTRLLQWLTKLVQKTMDTKNDTKETLDPNSKNNRAVS